MSLREKITSFLFPSEAAEGVREEPVEHVEAVTPAEPERIFLDQTVLELPADHPINRLYHQRRREVGYLPTPRICLDEEKEFPQAMVDREKNRLRVVLSSACGARLKAYGSGRETKKEEEPPPLDAQPVLFLSADKLYAWLIVLPPVGQGLELSRELLARELKEAGVTFGVDQQLVDRLPRMEQKYFNLFLIARGKPAFDGKNGNIVDYFPRVVERVLEVDEFDQVDYTALNLICNVKEGQEICRLIKPTEGEPGRTVLDEEIPAKSGRAVQLPKGRNTKISEDGVSLLAASAGHLEFTGRSFQVKPVLDIEANVDFSTGDINFLGDLNIKGDVRSGFTVRAMGNIRVGGVIEAGSSVEAGGDLFVVKGILGGGSTIVRAQRSIFAKYIENATVYVRENLQTDCIINGNIYCDGEVMVRSGRGSILGGRVWASKMITARTVGAQSECRTTVALGGMPCTDFERELVQQELKKLEIELEEAECQIDSPIKSSVTGKLRMKISVTELKLRQLEEDLEEIKDELEDHEGGRLECGVAYPGTEISFGDEVLRLRQETRQCVAKQVDGEIVLT